MRLSGGWAQEQSYSLVPVRGRLRWLNCSSDGSSGALGFPSDSSALIHARGDG